MRSRLSIAILVLAAFCGLFVQYQFRAPSRNFSDYRVYYDAGRNILEGKDIYTRHSEKITPFKYSPFFSVLLSALSFGSIRASASMFFILNLFFLLAIFGFSYKLLNLEKINFNKRFTIISITAILSFRFILHCLHSGQVGLFISAFLLAGLYFIRENKIVLGAFLIGAAIMTKYMPAVFILYFLYKKEYRVTFFIFLSLAFYLAIPALFIGFERNFRYLAEWMPYITSTSLDTGSMMDVRNNSFWAVINRLFPNIPSIVLLGVVVTIFLCLFAFVVFKNRERNIDYGLLFICIALFNPNAWQHNFVLLIFPYMLGVHYLFTAGFKDKGALALIVISFILCSWFSQSIAGHMLKERLDYFFPIVFGSLALFFALVKVKLNPASNSA